MPQRGCIYRGVCKANALSPVELIKGMAPITRLVFALANPDPEISAKLSHTAVRDDILMATGRSVTFPNQVNNALCFPLLCSAAPWMLKPNKITDEDARSRQQKRIS